MIVVDTNLLVYLFMPSENLALARRVLELDTEWIAPPLWKSEFRNVIVGYLRQQKLTLDATYQLMITAEGWMLNKEAQATSERILELAAQSNCSAYDCEFVALAQHLGLRLVTSDREILAAFPKIAVSLQAFGKTTS